MNRPQNFIEIKCPACRHTFYSKQTGQVECLYCKSIIELDKDNKVVDFEPPEYHGTTIMILFIISVIILTVIIGDALMSKNTLGKLTLIGVWVVIQPLLYFWLPIRYGFNWKYMRFGHMIGFTLVLLLLLIINLGNFIRYS